MAVKKIILGTDGNWSYGAINSTGKHRGNHLYVGGDTPYTSYLVFPSLINTLEVSPGDITVSKIVLGIVCNQRYNNVGVNVRINNTASHTAYKDGTQTLIYTSGNSKTLVEYDITEASKSDLIAKSTNDLVVHLQKGKEASGTQEVRFSSPAANPSNESLYPYLEITYESISGGGDGGGGDSGGGDDNTPTYGDLNSSSVSVTSSTTLGNTLYALVSGQPSDAYSPTYKWYITGYSTVQSNLSYWDTSSIDTESYVSTYFGPTSTSISGRVVATISNGGGSVEREASFKINLSSSYNPTITSYSYSPTSAYGNYAPGSAIKWSASALAKGGATISKYTISIPGLSISQTITGTSVSEQQTSNISNTATLGTYSGTITAYDSRGLSVVRNISITVSNKIPPILNLKCIRCNSSGVQDSINGTYFAITGMITADASTSSTISKIEIVLTQNGASKTYLYYPGTSTITMDTYFSPTALLSANTEIPFEVVVIATDSQGLSSDILLSGPSAAYIIHIKKGGKALGLGAASGENETITCGWKLLANGGLEIDGDKITISNFLPPEQGGTGVGSLSALKPLLGIPDDFTKYITSDNLENEVKKYCLPLTGGTMTGNIKLNSTSAGILGPYGHSLLWGSGYNTILGNSYGSCYINSAIYANKIATMSDIPDVPTIYFTTYEPSGSAGDIWLKPI